MMNLHALVCIKQSLVSIFQPIATSALQGFSILYTGFPEDINMVFLINTFETSPEREASIEGLGCGITRLNKNVYLSMRDGAHHDFDINLAPKGVQIRAECGS